MQAHGDNWATQILRDIQAQLGSNDPELLACGADIFDRLCFSCYHLDLSRDTLEELITAAHDKLKSSAINSNTLCWRRLFTDSCLLRTLADTLSPVDKRTALECIARLDRAIIVAGAAGEGRSELLLNVISKLQAVCSPAMAVLDFPSSSAELSHLLTASSHVMCLDTPPSLSSFNSGLRQTPFILRGFASDWPALHERPWSSFNYLRSVAGPGRIVPVEVGHDYRSDDWSQTLMPWDDFLAYLEQSHQSQKTEVLYLAQHNLLMQFPALRKDIIIPDYVYSCPDATSDFPNYAPPGNEEQLVINVWLGPKGTVSPAHTDPYFNVYVQVVGRKRIWLAPPRVSSSMYPFPPMSSASSDKAHHPAANTTNPSMSNTSRVDVFAEDGGRNGYPDFTENVVPNAISAILAPGDMLFFPPGWWHAMRSEENSFSVSMWF